MLTSVQISEADHKFVKSNGFKFSELMKEIIFQKKSVMEGVTSDNVFEERKKKERFIKMSEELRDRVIELETKLAEKENGTK